MLPRGHAFITCTQCKIVTSELLGLVIAQLPGDGVQFPWWISNFSGENDTEKVVIHFHSICWQPDEAAGIIGFSPIAVTIGTRILSIGAACHKKPGGSAYPKGTYDLVMGCSPACVLTRSQ